MSITKRGGLTFIKIGRINISYSVSKSKQRGIEAQDVIGYALALLPLVAFL